MPTPAGTPGATSCTSTGYTFRSGIDRGRRPPRFPRWHLSFIQEPSTPGPPQPPTGPPAGHESVQRPRRREPVVRLRMRCVHDASLRAVRFEPARVLALVLADHPAAEPVCCEA